MKTLIYLLASALIVGALVDLILRSMTNKKITDSKNLPMFGEQDAKEAIIFIDKKYGNEMAKLIEKIIRLETANFTSGQYKATGSAGMEEGKWPNLPEHSTAVFYDKQAKKDKTFIVWESVEDFADYLAQYILRYKGKFERWNSTDATIAAEYKRRVNTITPKFV